MFSGTKGNYYVRPVSNRKSVCADVREPAAPEALPQNDRRGRVIDPTYPYHPNRVYRGVPFTPHFVCGVYRKSRNADGVLYRLYLLSDSEIAAAVQPI